LLDSIISIDRFHKFIVTNKVNLNLIRFQHEDRYAL
jgi:hypothetical protein